MTSLILCCVPAFAESVAGAQGGAYAVNSSDGRITSLVNDDGTTVRYLYDAGGTESGMTVLANGRALHLQYSVTDTSEWIRAGSLPLLFSTRDSHGRTLSATLYPNMWLENGEWHLDVNAPEPIYAASFGYGPSGQLSSVLLSNGLSMQLTAPTSAGVVQQSLHDGGGVLMASAAPTGATHGVRIVPSQLDAVATQLGLGADWAETLTFSLGASGHLTTARNANGEVVLYLVDAGPFRVGYRPDGTAAFYDFAPAYGSGDGPDTDATTRIAGVAPAQIVITAEGATGMYTDRPAQGAIYGAWTAADGSSRHTILESPTDSSSSVRSPESRPRRVRADFLRRYSTRVCAGGACWERFHYEWIDDSVASPGGGSFGGGAPSGGGRAPGRSGNQIVGDPKLRAAADRALSKAKEKLQNRDCLALLERTGIANVKLIDMMRARRFDDPGAYLTTYLSYVRGGSSDCGANDKASTKVFASRVAICRSFGDSTDGWNALYLIHEMMHTLGFGEDPMRDWPTSSEINQMVEAACGAG